jgi:hypothetical protein
MFADVLFDPGVVLSETGQDIFLQFIPWRTFGFTELARGHLPLWNPHLFSGAPFLGGFQSALLYPLNLVHLLLPVSSAINLVIALHVFLTGFFMYGWARWRGLHPLAATVAGAMLMFSGPVFLHVYPGHLPNLCTMAWAPLIFLAVDRLLDQVTLRWTLIGAAAIALQVLAGHPQYAFYTGVAVILYLGVHAAVTRRGRVLSAGAVIAMYLGGGLIAAQQILAGLAAVSESVRERLPFDFVKMFSFPPENLLTLLVPDFFGGLAVDTYWGRGFLWEMSLFAGAVGLMCAVYGAWRGGRSDRYVSLWMTMVLFVLALGVHTPLLGFLYDFVPGFATFRGTSKFLFPLMLFLAMLAGGGVDRLSRETRPAGAWLSVVAGVAILLGIAGVVLTTSGAGFEDAWRAMMSAVRTTGEAKLPVDVYGASQFAGEAIQRASASMFRGAATLAVLSAILYWGRGRRWLAPAAALLCVAELFVFARSSRATFPVASTRLPHIEAALAADPGDYRIFNRVTPNLALMTGERDIWGLDAGVPLRYTEFMALAQRQSSATQAGGPVDPGALYRMLRLKYVIGLNEQGDPQLFETAGALPRASLVPNVRVVEGREAMFAALSDPTFDPAATVILETAPGIAVAGPAVESDRVTVTDRSTDAFSVEATLARPAILLITDSYSRDWHATSAPGSAQARYEILPANYVLMGVPLDAGHHVIEFEYRPALYVAGQWISGLSLLIFLAFGGIVIIRRHDRRDHAGAEVLQ